MTQYILKGQGGFLGNNGRVVRTVGAAKKFQSKERCLQYSLSHRINTQFQCVTTRSQNYFNATNPTSNEHYNLFGIKYKMR